MGKRLEKIMILIIIIGISALGGYFLKFITEDPSIVFLSFLFIATSFSYGYLTLIKPDLPKN